MGKIKGFFSSHSEEEQKMTISKPRNFNHTSSFKFNTSTGEIDVDNLPEEYIEIFKKAGITKKDLQDKKMGIEIFKMIADFNSDPNAYDKGSS